jgi:hypothetical protein
MPTGLVTGAWLAHVLGHYSAGEERQGKSNSSEESHCAGVLEERFQCRWIRSVMGVPQNPQPFIPQKTGFENNDQTRHRENVRVITSLKHGRAVRLSSGTYVRTCCCGRLILDLTTVRRGH